MALRTQLLVLALLMTSLLVVVQPSSATTEEKLRLTLELKFVDEDTLSLDLVIIQGLELRGQRGFSSLSELLTHNFGMDHLNAAGFILATSENQLNLTDQLIRGLQPEDPAPLVSSASGFWLFIYDNGIQVIVDEVDLDPTVAADLRPLLLFHQYQHLKVDSDVAELEVVVKTPAELTITTYSHEGTMFPNGQTYLTYEDGEFYHTFTSTPVYLDPTEVLGLGNHYGAGHIIKVESQPVYFQPHVMLAIFLLCFLVSFYLIKVSGKELLTKKGLPLPLGLFSWVFIALLFPLAFLPYHATIFISCSLFGLVGTMFKVRGARKLEKRGGPVQKGKRKGKKARKGQKGKGSRAQDPNAYRKPGGAKTSTSPVDQGLGSEAERSQLDALLGGGSGGGAPDSLQPLDKSDLTSVTGDLDDAGEFRPPEREEEPEEDTSLAPAEMSAGDSAKLDAMDALSAKLGGGTEQAPEETSSTMEQPTSKEPSAEPTSPEGSDDSAGLKPEAPPETAPEPIQPSTPTKPAGGMADRLARLDALSSSLSASPGASATSSPVKDEPKEEVKTDLSSLLGNSEPEPEEPIPSEPEVAEEPQLSDLMDDLPGSQPPPMEEEQPAEASASAEETPTSSAPAKIPELDDTPVAPQNPDGGSLSERLAALEALKKKL